MTTPEERGSGGLEAVDEIRARRLVVVDESNCERLVAEVVDDILELRMDLPSSRPGRRTSLLCFAAPGFDQMSAGIGVQLWVDGDVVDEVSWWADSQPSE